MAASERHALARERFDTARLLASVARACGFTPAPWLPATHVSPHMLGLPSGTQACVIDLDGVLTL
jgi:hypothetical protein